MGQFDNPYETKPGGARPIPGVIAQQMAAMIETGMKLVGISLYVHEHDGLAAVCDAILRAYPRLRDYWGMPKE